MPQERTSKYKAAAARYRAKRQLRNQQALLIEERDARERLREMLPVTGAFDRLIETACAEAIGEMAVMVVGSGALKQPRQLGG